jgi:glyoxylase-like metal-dependent hydrolase (beta-lactamase superfamily II)
MAETDFSIRSFKGGYDDNLTYLASCLRTGNQFLVDASVQLNQIDGFINKRGLIALFITHTHGDHIAYLDEYIDAFPNLVVMVYKESEHKINCDYIKPVKQNDIVTVGQLTVEILYTPGHYNDSICYYLDGVLFTGDTLFVGRTGRTISKGSDIKKLYKSVYDTILDLPESTMIYPGHDYGPKMSITIKENISISPLLRAEDEEDFIKRMAQYEATRSIGS